ncbi:MAG: phosphate signaling complex protein PhoU [Thermodesulfobacteriota bacterium]
MLTHMHSQLDDLRTRLLKMAALTMQAVDLSFKGFSLRDERLAYQVMEGDAELDAFECEIDNRCLRLLALDQPMALDLRLVITAMRMSVDLERIGDEAVIVAEQTLALAKLPKHPPHPLMEEFMVMSRSMLDKAVEAFRLESSAMAQEVVDMASDADDLNMRIMQFCMENMAGDKVTIHRALHRFTTAKAMGRICDLSANLGESVIFLTNGISIKHRLTGAKR